MGIRAGALKRVVRQEEPGGEETHDPPGKVSPAKHNLATERRARCQGLARTKTLIHSRCTKGSGLRQKPDMNTPLKRQHLGRKPGSDRWEKMGRRNLLTPSRWGKGE